MEETLILVDEDDCETGSAQNPTHLPAVEESSPTRHPLIRHLAVILDGNRRWAARQGLSCIEGYRAGGARVHHLLEWCAQLEIPFITLWPLSLENLQRDPEELAGLIDVIVSVINELANSGRWRLHILGDTDALAPAANNSIRNAQSRTRHVKGPCVNIAVAYSGRQEIIRAVRSVIKEFMASNALEQLPDAITEQRLQQALDTGDQPGPDLVIRTSGEQRLSGFMPWQCAYSEFYFSSLCWPEFTQEEFHQAMTVYQHRQKRFGV